MRLAEVSEVRYSSGAPFGTWIAGAVSPRVGSIMFAIYLCVLLIRSFFVAVKATRSARASA